MPGYVDGFVVPVPKRKVAAYQALSKKASRIWKEYGALDYKECVGDDLDNKMARTFPRGIKTKPGETVVFAWIHYKSRAHRDKVNKQIMQDPRIAALCNAKDMPFDCKRMLYGGFKVIVSI